MPYAGAVKAAERTPSEVQQDIIKAIGNRAIEPQAVVALVDQRTSLVSVPGDVNLPSRLQANAAGERLLDAITRAGGPKGPGYETWVTLERAGKRATVPFGSLIYDQINNIWIPPGDTIYLYREPQVVLASSCRPNSRCVTRTCCSLRTRRASTLRNSSSLSV